MIKASPFALQLHVALIIGVITFAYLNAEAEARFHLDDKYSFEKYCEQYNYPVESHQVTTADGYVLTHFRLQAKNTLIVQNKPVVIIQHGLFQMSDEMLLNEESKAPAFILANAGYDVWATNIRGTLHGDENIYFSKKSPQFWEYSFQQIAQYDLPATFELIAAITGQSKFDYIGHSQGTLMMFCALSDADPIVNRYLNRYIALAPIVYLNNTPNAFVKKLASQPWIDGLFNFLHVTQVLPYVNWQVDLQVLVCGSMPWLCRLFFGAVMGGDTKLIDYQRIDIYMGHTPGATSKQNLFHYQQFVNTGRFQKFDYGSAELNQQHYGQPTPPPYNLSNIQTPIYMFSGDEDALADPEDVQFLYNQLSQITPVYWQKIHAGHSSFILGKNMTFFNQQVLQILSGQITVGLEQQTTF